MCCSSDYSYQSLFYESGYSTWQYPTSSAREDPLPPKKRVLQISPASPLPSPPPQPQVAPSPVEIRPGVWELDYEVQYSPDWPPVQEYLSELRRARQMISPPSDLVFTLAALHVVHEPHDPAHWLIWDMKDYSTVGTIVDRIAFASPRPIRYPVLWHGFRDHRVILQGIQEKFNYIHIQQKWYPILNQPVETKRTLRSNASAENQAETPRTVSEYFNFVEVGSSNVLSRRKMSNTRKTSGTTTSPRRPKKTRSTLQPVHVTPDDETTQLPSDPSISLVQDSPVRSSTRMRKKVSPEHLKAPRVISAPAEESRSPLVESPESLLPSDPVSPVSSPISPLLLSSHVHLRSTSQSSVNTLVGDAGARVNGRSPSVTSTDTAVASSPSRKRKACNDVIEDDKELKDQDSSSTTEGMVTRGRGRVFKSHPSPETEVFGTCTPAPEIQEEKTAVKPSRARTKKTRV